MILEARGLAIGHKAIGRDIALSFAPGRILCLLGPNGCGKSSRPRASTSATRSAC